MIYIYTIITLLLNKIFDLIVAANYNNLAFLTPLFFLMLLPVLFKIINNNRIYLTIVIIVSIICNLFTENILLINTFTMVLIASFIIIYLSNKKLNIVKLLIINIISIIIYYLIINGISLLIYKDINTLKIINDILNSLTLNLIFSTITYLIFCRKLKN